jgi:hypothetical protein
VREHWRELDYWWWLWRKGLPVQLKVGLGVLLVFGLLAGGWFAADRMTEAQAGVVGTNDIVLETTVQRFVTVREHGKVVRKSVPVVKRVYLKPKTAYETRLKYQTRVVTVPGNTRVVRRVVTTLVPVVKRRVVTVKGKTHTIVQTRLVPTTRVQTATIVQTQTQMRTQVVTNQQTVTNMQNVTKPGQTVTVARTTTLSGNTVTVTKTETKTEVGPSVTVTVQGAPVTVTETVTKTETETVTVTEPKGVGD